MADTVKALFADNKVVLEHSAAAKELHEKSRFGNLQGNIVELSFMEAIFLADKAKIAVFDARNKEVSFDALFKKVGRLDKRLFVKYPVFADFRKRGYIVKTALKFGADFRVYERGVKPGEDHAKWIVFCVREADSHTWHDFSAKNHVAHSTKKKLLIAVVDEEGDVSYWEVSWVKP